MSSTVNPRHPGTLPKNIINNTKNDGHCLAVTTHRVKHTIDPPIPTEVERVTEKDENEVEVIEDPESQCIKGRRGDIKSCSHG